MTLGVVMKLGSDGKLVFESTSGKPSPREGKGKSLLAALSDFTALDIETTGLSPEYDSIIELAAIRYRDGQAVASFEQLVNPEYEIDDFISGLTGITNEMLKNAPVIGDVIADFVAFIGDDVIVGHNVNFDVNFIYDACKRAGLSPFKNNFVDTLRISRRLYKDWPNYKLDTLISKLCVDSRELHRALNDTALTAKCYLSMAANPLFASTDKSTVSGKAKNVVAEEGYTDEDNPLYGKVCVFTGALDAMTRQEAMQVVSNIGGICGDSVTKKTNYLILGNNDYCKSIKGGKSTKQKKAEMLILQGADLEIIPESLFYELISSYRGTHSEKLAEAEKKRVDPIQELPEEYKTILFKVMDILRRNDALTPLVRWNYDKTLNISAYYKAFSFGSVRGKRFLLINGRDKDIIPEDVECALIGSKYRCFYSQPDELDKFENVIVSIVRDDIMCWEEYKSMVLENTSSRHLKEYYNGSNAFPV